MTPGRGAPSARGLARVDPVLLVLVSIVSVQFGGALAATLLPLIGVVGSVTLRLGLSAALLLLVGLVLVAVRRRNA